MSEPRFELDPTPFAETFVEEVVALWTDVSNAGGAVGFVPPVQPADVEPLARATLRGVEDGPDHLVTARVDEDLVGIAFLVHRPGDLFRHWATVKRLQVHPRHQGTGLGGQLLLAVHDAARSLELEHVRLSVRGGTGTEGFYLRHGWEEIVRIPRSIRVADGDIRDELWLIRWL